MDAELAATVADPLAEHQAFAQLAVGQPEAVALLVEDFHLALQALLDVQLGVLEVVAQHGFDQCRRVCAQAEQAEIGQQALPVQFRRAADGLAAEPDQGEQLLREGVMGAAGEAGAVSVLLPDRQQQALQTIVEQVEKVAGRIAVLAVAKRLFAVEGRQRRAGAEQADQVDAQARAPLAMLLEELHLLDIAAGKAQARVGLELQALVERLVIQTGIELAQAIEHQQHALEQAVFADAAVERFQSSGC